MMNSFIKSAKDLAVLILAIAYAHNITWSRPIVSIIMIVGLLLVVILAGAVERSNQVAKEKRDDERNAD